MNNKYSFKQKITLIVKVIFFPVYLFTLLLKLIKAKIQFSIRLNMACKYLKILIGAMAASGIGIVLVCGALFIQDKISQDYSLLANSINYDYIEMADVQKYADENRTPITIYDRHKNVLFMSNPSLVQHGYQKGFDIVWTEQHVFLGINRNMVISGDPAEIVIYSEIEKELAKIEKISRLTAMIYGIILLLSILLMFLSGRGTFQPIREMTQTVKEISEKNLNLRLNVSGSKNELKQLALTFNEMMNRIEDHANRQKQFVSDASHELRTPIAVIQGYAVMLDRWGKNDREVLQESITAIKNEAESMHELIDKLLFLARHDNSTFEFQKEEFSLTELLFETIKETQIIDANHQIHCEISKEVSLSADKNRIKQAIRIFMDNAIKYTPAGGNIVVSLQSGENDIIAVSIKDTGIGMSKQELEHIFDRFYRADVSRTKEKGGHGLGLAIAKIIILGHNGKIKVKSKVGEGTEFIIQFPQENRDDENSNDTEALKSDKKV